MNSGADTNMAVLQTLCLLVLFWGVNSAVVFNTNCQPRNCSQAVSMKLGDLYTDSVAHWQSVHFEMGWDGALVEFGAQHRRWGRAFVILGCNMANPWPSGKIPSYQRALR